MSDKYDIGWTNLDTSGNICSPVPVLVYYLLAVFSARLLLESYWSTPITAALRLGETHSVYYCVARNDEDIDFEEK